MSELDVRIVKLEPMRVASAFGFGEQPEYEAWEKILTWAKSVGITDFEGYRFFGFNNPSPSPGNPNYGYEQWMTVDADVQPGEGIDIKEFAGGLYAVTRSLPDLPDRDSMTEEEALHQLEQFLQPRIDAAADAGGLLRPPS
jgi:DNA gyrase inhibitor GyrI